ncbi:MAG: hypothetical protein GY749_44580, partial [Desulfobacteraceae bacterium]|nr:hypothetical protein [Desulfobacteraceae bacterium]
MKDKYAETGLTMKELAAHFGCTEASISRVINEKHNGKELTRKVEEYLDSIIYKDIRGTEYDLTPGQKRGMVLLQLLKSDNKFGLLLGHSGIGKTYMCRRFQEKEPDTRVFTPDEGMSMGGLLTGLCRLWGIGGTGTIDQKRSRLKESAKGRFLIV